MIKYILTYAVVALSAISASALPRHTVYPGSLDASAITAIHNSYGRSGHLPMTAIVEFASQADLHEISARYPEMRINTVYGTLASVIIPAGSLQDFASDPDVVLVRDRKSVV